ncbi:uncharacterized protein DNG_02632 [Cephalotrichum gorgonifer]|uniref:Uncharacterized protein n=1 Tax=Cephalotrichum gorgonifer TaxID=2041049 RepID=A0AAE8MTD4_9PEZI|nr:uncharacterized protein DNG_02632 [Cephalotrichum gorgonifer]
MSSSKKRPAEGDGPTKKKRRKAKPKFEDDELIDLELGVNGAIARLDSQLMGDHFAQKTSRFGTDLSPVELSDLSISAVCIKDTTSWKEQRITDKLPEFLEEVAGDAKSLSEAPKDVGAPHTLIVTGAGLRAADIVRAVRKFQTKQNTVAKLFAKHMKVEEQVNLLRKTRTGIGVGTPARLIDLLEREALSIAHLKRIVVDASHVDQKKRGVMDMKDTMMPLAQLLSRKELKDRYTSEEAPVELIFY